MPNIYDLRHGHQFICPDQYAAAYMCKNINYEFCKIGKGHMYAEVITSQYTQGCMVRIVDPSYGYMHTYGNIGVDYGHAYASTTYSANTVRQPEPKKQETREETLEDLIAYYYTQRR